MADRLLLESGAPDGYLLEDGTGVLLLDAAPGISIGRLVDSTDLTVYTLTLDRAITANKPVTIGIVTRSATLAPTVDSVTGGGMTWAAVANALDASEVIRTTVYEAAGVASPSGTTLTITCSAAATRCDAHVIEWTGVDAADPVVQSATAFGDNTTTTLDPGAGLATLGAAENPLYGVFGSAQTGDTTPGSGFTELDDTGGSTAPNSSLQAEWRIPTGTSDKTTNASWAAGKAAAVAVEMRAVSTGPQNISGAGAVASVEAFGTARLDQNVSAVGAIATAEAFGTTSVAQLISPTGIATAEAFGTARLDQSIVAGGIASLETFGTARLDQNVTAAGAIPTAEAFGTASLNHAVAPTGIATAEAFGSATVNAGSVTVSPTAIATAEAFGTPELTFATLITVPAIASVEAFGSATLTTGAVTVSPGGIASAEAFGGAVLTAGAVTVAPGGIGTAEAFGTASLGLWVRPGGIASTEAVGAPTLQLAPYPISPSGIVSAEAFGTPVLDSDQNIVVTGIASGEVFGTPDVTATRWKIYVDGIDRTSYARPLRAFHLEQGGGAEVAVIDVTFLVAAGAWTPYPEDSIRVLDSAVEVYEGFLKQRQVAPIAGSTSVWYRCSGTDNTSLLDTDYITTAVRSTSETAKARIEWLLTTYGTKGILGGATIVAPQSIPSGTDGIPRQDFNGYSLRDAIEAVLDVVGRDHQYYVDRDLKLHVFEDTEASMDAPFDFSETPNGTTTEPLIGFQMDEDSSLLRHKQLVVGGTDRGIRRERTLTNIGETYPPVAERIGRTHVDSSITSDAQADALADNLLRQYGHTLRTGSVVTYRAGIKAGQNAEIHHPAAGLVNFPIRVRQVDADLVSDTLVRYTVHWGDRPPYLSNWRDAHFSAEELPIPPGADSITGDMIVDNAIVSTHITNGSILTPKLAANAITANEIATNAVTTVKINAQAITTAKIAANAITATEIAADAVTTAKIAAGAVTANEIAANTITAGQIAADAITASELAVDSVAAENIVAGTITATELAANSVTASEIAANAVTATKIAAGSITTDKLVAGQVEIKNASGTVILNADAVAVQIHAQWNFSIGATSVAGSTVSRQNLSGWGQSYPPFCVGMVNVGGGKSVLMPYTQWNVTSGVYNTYFYAYSTSTFVECVRSTRVAAPSVSFRVLALVQGAING